MKRSTKNNIKALSCVLPAMAYFLFFSIPPIIMLFYYSFTDLKIVLGTEKLVGIQNFKKIFIYPEYIRSLNTTFLMTLFLMAFGISVGFGIALLLNSLGKYKSFFRTLWYLPVLISMPVISKLLGFMLWEDGAFNMVLRVFGHPGIVWYDSTFWMYFWIIFLMTWKGTGGTALLFIAGLNSISRDIYDAAKIDGVNRFQNMTRITLPLMRPLMGFVIINGLIGALGIFEPMQLISKGGPGDSTSTILYRIYDEAFLNFKQGFASALSVLVFAVTLILTVFSMKFTDSTLITGKVRD
jgi:multiple sugar transport system permease protein